MSTHRKKRFRKKKMRSYRNTILFLSAFGLAGLALGVGLIGWGLLADKRLMLLGFVYILVSLILIGLRGVFIHLDDARKRKHVYRSTPRRSS